MLRALPAVLVIAACAADPSGGIDGTSHVIEFDVPGGATTAFDVLFVIDDSAAIAPYVDRVAVAADALASAARATPTGPLDLHVGAITTTGTAELRAVPAIDGTFLVDVHAPNGTRTENYDGSLGAALRQLVAAGTAGTASSQPLANARAVLEGAGDFVRASANTGVVFVTAQDDASPDTPEAFAQAIRATRADPSDVVAIGAYTGPAPRLDAVLAAFPNRSAFADLATGDLGQAFALLDLLEKTTLGVPCLEEPADVDPDTPGPQYECAVTAIREDGVETVLPACDAGLPGGCWRLTPEPNICLDTTVRLTFRGFDGMPAPHVRGACVGN
jgi:hypothetical protein